MNGRDVLMRALRGETTPRAAWVPFVGVHGGKLIGATAREYLQSADLMVQGLRRARDLYRPDGLPVAFDLQMEAQVLGCRLSWADQTPPSVCSHPLSVMEGDGLEIADLPAFSVAQGRYPLVLSALDRLRVEFGGRVALYGLITGPFTLALHLMGNDIFLEMFDRPQHVADVMRFCAQVAVKAADGYLDHGADVVAVVDPMTSQISPEHFEEFVTPAISDIFTHVRQRGAISSLFVCGDATRNLAVMCRTPCDNVSVDENISLEQLKSLARGAGKSFGGNLKLTTALLMGSADDARRDALRCIDVGGNQGFVLAPGCDLPYAVPEENLQAVSELVHDEYQRNVARSRLAGTRDNLIEDVRLPDYDREDAVTVDIITLDSASCAPCQYMVGAVLKARQQVDIPVKVREHKVTTREGVAHMVKLGVEKVPTICIDGQVRFASIIPDLRTLTAAIVDRAQAKSKAKAAT